MSNNTLNSNIELIGKNIIFDNGVKGKILFFDEKRNVVVFCNRIEIMAKGNEKYPDFLVPLRISHDKLDSTIEDWLRKTFSKREIDTNFEITKFYRNVLKKGECYYENDLYSKKNGEIEYLDKVGVLSYNQAINLGAKRSLDGSPPEGNSCSFFENCPPSGSWLSTIKGNKHPIYLSTSYVITRCGSITIDDFFNGRGVNPLICISGDMLYTDGIGDKSDPIKILKKKA